MGLSEVTPGLNTNLMPEQTVVNIVPNPDGTVTLPLSAVTGMKIAFIHFQLW